MDPANEASKSRDHGERFWLEVTEMEKKFRSGTTDKKCESDRVLI